VSVDLDSVPALAVERDALWARLATAQFLTEDEKRRMAGVEAPERMQ
jgi:phage portal protein BeeE